MAKSEFGRLHVVHAHLPLIPLSEVQTEQAASKSVKAPRRAGYMGQLDSIRAIACITVIVFHEAPLIGLPFLGEIGANGLSFFFVMSGFLISGILLRARDDAERTGTPIGAVLGAFYARRFLRIFPLYYFVLAALFILNVQTMRQNYLWHGLYLSNILSARAGNYVFPTHFWSLGVEEQFYLGWSAVALFAPRRALKWVALAMVAAGPISRFIFLELTNHKVTATSVPTSCLDMLGIGCLLALLWHQGEATTRALRARIGRVLMPLGLSLIALQSVLQYFDVGYMIRVTLWTLPCAMFGFWVVDNAATGFKGLAGRIFEWRPLLYLGTISYGLYVYHIFVPLTLRGLGIPFPEQRGLGRVLVVTSLTIVVASLSWHFLEKPLNDVKRYFPYVKKRSTSSAALPTVP
jgi:peptidoglycan/LPS O-acetylase OafA/YrhL